MGRLVFTQSESRRPFTVTWPYRVAVRGLRCHGCLLLAGRAACLRAAVDSYGRCGDRGGGSCVPRGRHPRRSLGILRLQARTLTYPWRIFFDGRLQAKGPVNQPRAWETKADVDRLYLRLYLAAVDLTFGRQTVNWGVGYAWSPTDVFNPPDPTDPQGLRRSIDAAVAQVPVGPLDYWTVAVADQRFGVRRRGNMSGTDWSLARDFRCG